MTEQPGALWPPPPGRPVGALPTEAYASWIGRVGAWIIDQALALIFAAIGGLIERATGDAPWGRFLACVFIPTAVCVLIAMAITHSVAAGQG